MVGPNGKGPFLTIGGGNDKGAFNKTNIYAIINGMDDVPKAGYSGIVFDIEEVNGTAAEINPVFKSAFMKAKSLNLTIVVTTSHSAPSKTDTPQDAIDFVKFWANDSDIDILSP